MAKGSKKRVENPKKRMTRAQKQPLIDEFVKNFPMWKKRGIQIPEMAQKVSLSIQDAYSLGVPAAEVFWGISHEDALYKPHKPHQKHFITCKSLTQLSQQEASGTEEITSNTQETKATEVQEAENVQVINTTECGPTSVENYQDFDIVDEIENLMRIATQLANMEVLL